MTLDALIMSAGVFVFALPFLGFPASWDAVLLSLAGIAVIGLGIAVRRRGLRERAPRSVLCQGRSAEEAPAQSAPVFRDEPHEKEA